MINAAASDAPGETALYRPGPADANRARASLLRHSYLTGTAVTVPVVTIDEVCHRPASPLIKIDVEGHEAAVMRGAARVIARDAPAIIFEYAPAAAARRQPDARSGRLAEGGYRDVPHPAAARHGLTGRGRLVLERLPAPPAAGGDIVAVSPAMAGRLSGIIR